MTGKTTPTMTAALGAAWRLAGVAALLLALVAGLARPAAAQGDRLQVVATNSILGDIVRNVAGDAADVTTLVGIGGDSHTYEPTPADADALAGADVIIENGLGLEPWLVDLVEASGTGATVVVASEGITPLPADEGDAHEGEDHAGDARGTAEPDGHAAEEEDHAAEEEDHAAEEDHDHGEFDPHVWFDVANVVAMTGTIEAALAAADAANAATYAANAEAYRGQLQALDAAIVAQVETLAPEQRLLVTSHDTFRYFAARYGFTIVGTALGSVTTESADPSASEIAALVDEISATGVRAIFPENVSDPGLLEQIASEAGVSVGPPLYTDALGEPGGEAGTYVDLMTYDVTAIVTALAG